MFIVMLIQKENRWRQVGTVSADCMLCVCSHPQEYTEEFRDIAKGRSKEAIPGIMLINQRPVGEDLHVNGFFVFFLFLWWSVVSAFLLNNLMVVVKFTLWLNWGKEVWDVISVILLFKKICGSHWYKTVPLFIVYVYIYI